MIKEILHRPVLRYVLLNMVFIASNFIRVLVSDTRGLGDAGWIYLLLNFLSSVGWSIAGISSVSILLFFHNLVRPSNSLKPGLWAMASVGVIIGVFLWPFVEQWLSMMVKDF